MKLALTKEEIGAFEALLNYSKFNTMDVKSPQRGIFEKFMTIKDRAKNSGSYIFLSTDEE